jgi:hypothetical protein
MFESNPTYQSKFLEQVVDWIVAIMEWLSFEFWAQVLSKAFEPCSSKRDEYGVLLFVALIQYANLEVDLAFLFLCRHPISLCK